MHFYHLAATLCDITKVTKSPLTDIARLEASLLARCWKNDKGMKIRIYVYNVSARSDWPNRGLMGSDSIGSLISPYAVGEQLQ